MKLMEKIKGIGLRDWILSIGLTLFCVAYFIRNVNPELADRFLICTTVFFSPVCVNDLWRVYKTDKRITKSIIKQLMLVIMLIFNLFFLITQISIFEKLSIAAWVGFIGASAYGSIKLDKRGKIAVIIIALVILAVVARGPVNYLYNYEKPETIKADVEAGLYEKYQVKFKAGEPEYFMKTWRVSATPENRSAEDVYVVWEKHASPHITYDDYGSARLNSEAQ